MISRNVLIPIMDNKSGWYEEKAKEKETKSKLNFLTPSFFLKIGNCNFGFKVPITPEKQRYLEKISLNLKFRIFSFHLSPILWG